MAPWIPAASPWRKPTDDTMARITKGTATKNHITMVLHCSDKDCMSMAPWIEKRLTENDIPAAASLGSDARRQQISDIAKELYDDPQFSEMLHWTVRHGSETQDVVERTLGCHIRNVHNARKRRGNRGKSEPSNPAKVESANEELPLSQASPAIQATGSKPPHTLSSSPTKSTNSTYDQPQKRREVIIVTLPTNSRTVDVSRHGGDIYYVSIGKEQSSEDKFNEFRERVRDLIKNNDQNFLVSETNVDGNECICQDAATFEALLFEKASTEKKLKLNVIYLQPPRSSKSTKKAQRVLPYPVNSYHFLPLPSTSRELTICALLQLPTA